MSRACRTLCLLTVFIPSLLHAVESPAWRLAQPGWKYVFPRDHGPHREFKTEWWYATGNLVDVPAEAKGREHEYGFQITFFREGIQPGTKQEGSSRFRVTELPFAHFAFTDVQGQTFNFFQQSSRGAFGEAGFATPREKTPGRIAWMNDWVLEQPSRLDAQENQTSFHLKASGEGRSVDLILTQTREPLIHGENGISPKSDKPGHASHYYSLTRLQASGTVSIDGKSHAVHGTVWFDHEWASNSLAPDEAGWDWSGLHLSNGDDLMLFRIRDAQGKTVFRSGTLREASGVTHDIKDLDLISENVWKSPHTQGSYPSSWKVSIPSQNLELSLHPKLADQELVLTPFAYWEGAVKGTGMRQNKPIAVEGYFEMTGYGGKILGMTQ